MTAMRPQLVETATALFATDPDWATIAEIGFPLLLVPEAAGGFGGDWGDAFAVLRVAGARPLAQPLAEAMLAADLLARAGRTRPPGLTVIGHGAGRLENARFTGHLAAVPWGRDADHVLACVETGGDMPEMLLLPKPAAIVPGTSPAQEPRDRLDYRECPTIALGRADHRLFCAFLRVAQASGALDSALALAIDHVNARVQFGKPLSRLQAVQQSLAVLAEEAAAVAMAGAAAAQALENGGGVTEMMAAKLRTNMAIHRGVALAHQVHGAIGFTRDYPLHPLTRRLMGWRSDFGGDSWAQQLGAMVMERSGTALWASLAADGDR